MCTIRPFSLLKLQEMFGKWTRSGFGNGAEVSVRQSRPIFSGGPSNEVSQESSPSAIGTSMYRLFPHRGLLMVSEHTLA